MLEAVRTLATITNYTDEQLENWAKEFGNIAVECMIPVGVLIRARREYKNYANPQDAVTTCGRIVALAEILVDAIHNQPGNYQEEYLALSRQIDNLRNYSQTAAMKE